MASESAGRVSPLQGFYIYVIYDHGVALAYLISPLRGRIQGRLVSPQPGWQPVGEVGTALSRYDEGSLPPLAGVIAIRRARE